MHIVHTGPRYGLLRADDDTVFDQPGAVLARAEKFNEGSFFGLPYADEVNRPQESWWYPNVPAIMRTDKRGELVNIADTWLSNGWGTYRSGCSLVDSWNSWKCQSATLYRRLVLESMDPDHEIRRVSPVAFTSDGHTSLLNGQMDHGWCFSYTCLKRLMTFAPTVAIGKEYTVHFAGTNPQKMRITLAHATDGEKLILKIYYQNSQRLNVFVGDRFVEDVNMFEGSMKKQLVRNGKWASNNDKGTYDEQVLDMARPCMLADSSGVSRVASPALCSESPGNIHGANTFNRKTGMLEIVIGKHSLNEYIDIITTPTVQMTMAITASVENFYEIKDAFVSSIAGFLGIDVNRIAIVDVVPGNARRRVLGSSIPLPSAASRRQLLQDGESSVDLEILPDAELNIADTTVWEDAGLVNVTVSRSVNLYPGVSATFTALEGNGTARNGIHFSSISTTITFAPGEMKKEVSIPIYSIPGFAASNVTFNVKLTNAENATIAVSSADVNIGNVHAPEPGAPSLKGTVDSESVISIQWTAPVWTNAPSPEFATILDYQVEKGRVASSSADVTQWETITANPATTSLTVNLLDVYSMWKFRARARTAKGWTDWSGTSDGIRTLALCGDGKRHASEECDDSNTDLNDGCSSACQVENGFSCAGGTPSSKDARVAACGDVKSATEECDDGNNNNDDGCKSCQIVRGWKCNSNTDGEVTSGCQTTCGDGVKAGNEQCDTNGTIGHGCNADCTMVSNAICIEDEDLLSHCRLCGNGVREQGEACDDDATSGGCTAGCMSVTVGWHCSGGTLSVPDTCVAGPSIPSAPVVSSKTTTQISFTWSSADGRGLPVLHYVFEYDVKNVNGTLRHDTETVLQTGFTVTGLRFVDVVSGRVKACSTVGCSGFSPFGAPTTAKPPPASAQLLDVVATITADPVALMAGTNISLTGLSVQAPDPEPEAPLETKSPILNETQILALLQQLAQNNGSVIFEGTPLPIVTPAPPGSGGVAFGNPAAGFWASSVVVVAGEVLTLEVRLTTYGNDNMPFSGAFTTIRIDWQTHERTAMYGIDYKNASGSLVFDPAVKSQSFRIATVAHSDSSSKLFGLCLKSLVGAKPHPDRSCINITILSLPSNVSTSDTTSHATTSSADSTAYTTTSSIITSTTPPPATSIHTSTTPQPAASIHTSTTLPPATSIHTSTTPPPATKDIVVNIVVGLPLTLDEFTDTVQLKFRKGIAVAAGVNVQRVFITKISNRGDYSRRHLLAEWLAIDVEVTAANASAAETVSKHLVANTISASLESQNLPGAVLLQPPTLSVLPESCNSISPACEAALKSCMDTTNNCSCITTYYSCAIGCHTSDTMQKLLDMCNQKSCDDACPLTADPSFAEKYITDFMVENRILLPSGQGVIIPAGALDQPIKIGVHIISTPPRMPGHQISKGLKIM